MAKELLFKRLLAVLLAFVAMNKQMSWQKDYFKLHSPKKDKTQVLSTVMLGLASSLRMSVQQWFVGKTEESHSCVF